MNYYQKNKEKIKKQTKEYYGEFTAIGEDCKFK